VSNSLLPVSETPPEESTSPTKVKNFSTVIQSVIQNLISANFIDFLPNPIRSLIFLVKEVFYVIKKFGGRLPKLISKPVDLIFSAFPYILALALIVMSFIPPLIIPTKIIAFLLSILGLFNNYFALFDKNYLSQL
jgi:hypothetical protein